MRRGPRPAFTDRVFGVKLDRCNVTLACPSPIRPCHTRNERVIFSSSMTFVGQAIESALEQTHPVQVIAVDDGSTDDSREIIARFDSRVLPIFKPNGGQGSAMNEGFTKTCVLAPHPGVGDADAGRRILGCCGRLARTRGGIHRTRTAAGRALGVLPEARPERFSCVCDRWRTGRRTAQEDSMDTTRTEHHAAICGEAPIGSRLAVGATLSPAPMAVTLLRWFYDPKSRPRWLRAFTRRSRRPSLS